MITIEPITLQLARLFITLFHRHHLPPQGWIFGLGAYLDGILVGAITVGRPVSRHYNGSYTIEVTRCCTDGTPHICSLLYGAAFKAAKALKYDTLITYTLNTERGTSLIASSWKFARLAGGGEWSSPSRPRAKSTSPTCRKKLWYKSILPVSSLPPVIHGSAVAKPLKKSARCRSKPAVTTGKAA